MAIPEFTDNPLFAHWLPNRLKTEGGLASLRARLFILFTFGTVAIGAPFAVVYWLAFEMPLAALAIGIWAVAAMATPAILKWSERIEVASNCLSLELYLLVLFLSAQTGGIESGPVIWLLAVPVYSLLFGSFQSGIAWSVITLATYTGFFAAPYLGVPVGEPPEPGIQQQLTYAALTSLSCLVLLLFALYKQFVEQLEVQRTAFEKEARYDPLTGLPNRIEFRKRLRQKLETDDPNTPDVAVGFVDLDRFKAVNESLGQTAGDNLLKDVACRLETVVRDNETVARFAGDEFVLLLQREKMQSLSEVGIEVQSVFDSGFYVNDAKIPLTASVGFATSQKPTDSRFEPEELLDVLVRTADRAMFEAKSEPNTSWEIFDPTIWGEASEQVQREARLRRAIENEEFIPYFQPIFRVDDHSLFGFEVLARWDHPEQGILSPGTFIPLAERLGLMGSLGNLLLKQTFRAFEGIPGRLLPVNDCRAFINLSPKQLESETKLDEILTLVAESNLEAIDFCFEITESDLLSNRDRARAIRQAGFEVAIDDFGTGYSSLARLRDMHVDGLKLDMEFLRDVPENRTNTMVAQTIVDLGHRLDIPVIGEGVEERKQLDFLNQVDCTAAQGYFLGRPAPLVTLLDETSAVEPACEKTG